MTLKTLENSLEILEFFIKEKNTWGVRELAKAMNRSHSVVHRTLRTFEKYGYLSRNKETQRYELGLKFFEFGQLIQEKLKFKNVIMPMMEKIADEANENVFFTLVDNTEGVCIAIAESNRSIKFEVTIGSRTPLYAGASCRVIMAYLQDELKQKIIRGGLKRLTRYTIVNPDDLLMDLENIKSKGWSYTVGEFTEDVAGISVPIFDNKGDIFASLTIAAPSYRVNEKKVNMFLKLLKDGAREVQSKIQTYHLNSESISD